MALQLTGQMQANKVECYADRPRDQRVLVECTSNSITVHRHRSLFRPALFRPTGVLLTLNFKRDLLKVTMRRFGRDSALLTLIRKNYSCVLLPLRSCRFLGNLCPEAPSFLQRRRGTAALEATLYDAIVVSCLVCRSVNTVDSVRRANRPVVLRVRALEVARTVSSECVVCLDREPDIRFPRCNHVCVCRQCFREFLKLKSLPTGGFDVEEEGMFEDGESDDHEVPNFGRPPTPRRPRPEESNPSPSHPPVPAEAQGEGPSRPGFALQDAPPWSTQQAAA